MEDDEFASEHEAGHSAPSLLARGSLPGGYADVDGSQGDQEGALLGLPGPTEVIYVHEGVVVSATARQQRRNSIAGRLSLVRQHCEVYLSWVPYSHRKRAGSAKPVTDVRKYTIHPLPFADIKAIRVVTSWVSWQHLVVTLRNGFTLPPLFFPSASTTQFIATLKEHKLVTVSSTDDRLLLVSELPDLGRTLARSLHALDLDDLIRPAARPRTQARAGEGGGPGELSRQGSSGRSQGSMSGSIYLPGISSLHQSTRQLANTLGSSVFKAVSSASTAAMTNLSRLVDEYRGSASLIGTGPLIVGDFDFYDHIPVGHSEQEPNDEELAHDEVEQDVGQSGDNNLAPCTDTSAAPADCPPTAADKDVADGSGDIDAPQLSASTATTSATEAEFEVLDEEALQGYDHSVAARPAPDLPPLDSDSWAALQDQEGRLVDLEVLREAVFNTGLSQAVRPEAWPFLLGLYDQSSTAAERKATAEAWRTRYTELLQQWQTLDASNSSPDWLECVDQVEKDVLRTDRQHPFYSARGGAGIKALRRILLTYTHAHGGLYSQGMSDMASPLLAVLQDEAGAYAALEAVMDRCGPNFLAGHEAMHQQLNALKALIQILDPELHTLLDSVDQYAMFFAFRWLLVWFKREFSFTDVLRLWEALWSCPVTPHLHLYLGSAILIQHRRAILESVSGLDDLLKLTTELAGKLAVQPLLKLSALLVRKAGNQATPVLAPLPVRCH